MNPFKYGQVVGGSDFCARPDLEETVAKHIESNQNIHVTGERRTGKTSLVLETVHRLKKTKLVHIDLFQVKSARDIYTRMLDGMVTQNVSGGFLKSLMTAIVALRPTMSYDQVTGAPSVSIAPAQRIMPDSIAGLLDFMNGRSRRGRLVIFFDEFQDVSVLKDSAEILAVMRSRIQLHTQTTYVYAGSVRSRMEEIFYSPDSPFYKSAIPVAVESINSLAFCNYIMRRFEQGGRSIAGESIEKVFELTNENPGDVQELCNALWDTTAAGMVIGAGHIHDALKEIFSRERAYYEHIMNILSETQLKCLRGLAAFNGERMYSKDFLEFTGIGQPGTVTRALKRMIGLKIIYSYGKRHRFASPFFRLWLLAGMAGGEY